MKQILLKPGKYKEVTLVNMLCTEAQKRNYHKKERFTGARQRIAFLDTLSKYCDFEQIHNSNQYKVKKVFKFPKTLAETKIHKGIYQYLTPLILDEVIRNISNRQAIYSTYDLIKATHIANHNYHNMKYSQSKVSKSLDIPLDTISEYFDKTDGYITNYIKQCLNYLKSMCCIIYNEIYIIKTLQSKASGDLHCVKIEVNSNIHKATEQEMKLYTQLMEQADKAAGITTNQQRFYGRTAKIYQRTLSKLLKDNDISFICKAFEIFCVHPDRCKQIAQTFSNKPLEQYKREIGTVMKMRSDANARNRTSKHIYTDNNYLENFKNLSELSLLYGADDITVQMPEIKDSYAEHLQAAANEVLVQYRERLQNGYKIH